MQISQELLHNVFIPFSHDPGDSLPTLQVSSAAPYIGWIGEKTRPEQGR